jgi:hypothetical protein
VRSADEYLRPPQDEGHTIEDWDTTAVFWQAGLWMFGRRQCNMHSVSAAA